MQDIALSGNVGLDRVGALAGELAGAIAAGGAVISVVGLDGIDAAGLQLLLSAHRSATEAGVPLGFDRPDHPALRTAVVAHGLIGADTAANGREHDFWTQGVLPAAEA